MKKKIIISFSIIALLSILSLTSSVSATGFAGHTFSEDYFAVEVDLAVDDVSNPDIINDLLDAGAPTGDSDENENLQFYMAYMNNSGIEVAYSALEKLEYKLKLGDFIENQLVKNVLNGIPSYKATLDEPVFNVSATAPFQQLVQHYTTPWNEDVFVTNNFMSLIAYSSSPDDQLMDSEDELYLGYTFSVQELIDEINAVLINDNPSKAIDHFEVTPYFEALGDGSFKFGINYTNMFVLWQSIDVEPRGIDVIGGAASNPGGVIFGRDIVAASMLDYIAFEYEYTTQTFTGASSYTEGVVTSHYYIGETNLLITKDSVLPTANWNHTPFRTDVTYHLDVPEAIEGVDVPTIGPIPSAVDINIPGLAFYTDDDAKARIRMQDGFGITVATATTTFGVSVSDPTYEDNLGTAETLGLQMGGNTFFETIFTGKMNYKLKGLEDLWGINETTDRPVHIIPFIPSSAWGIKGFTDEAKAYFKVEFELAYGFTKFMATQLTPQIFSMPNLDDYVTNVIYFTFTEFPEWYGGEIVHDPSYSAIAAAAAQAETTSTDLPPGTTTPLNIPGFELLTTLLAIPPLYALYRKRRN